MWSALGASGPLASGELEQYPSRAYTGANMRDDRASPEASPLPRMLDERLAEDRGIFERASLSLSIE